VIAYPDVVVAFLLASRERQIAVRTWELIPEEGGIIRTCECEKGAICQATGMVIRPSERQSMEQQILQEITAFRTEYGLPAKKVNFNQAFSPDSPLFPLRRFKLTGLWEDEEALDEARKTFARLYWKK
jgi:hypothetical protein